MRSQMKVFMWFLITAFVVTIFYVWGAGGKLGRDENVLADVGKDQITQRDLEASVRQLQEKYKQADPIQLRQYAFQQLVQKKLILKASERMNVPASREMLKLRRQRNVENLRERRRCDTLAGPWVLRYSHTPKKS